VIVVDSRGTWCPTPIIDLARASADQPAGTTLRLLADDPAAAYDVPAWCRMRGHALHAVEPLDPDPDQASGRVARAFDVVLGGATASASS
jgi:TusA-related sulfurtransferase